MPTKRIDTSELKELLDLVNKLCDDGKEFYERLSSFAAQFSGIESIDYAKEKFLNFFGENNEMALTLTKLQLLLMPEDTGVVAKFEEENEKSNQ